MSSTPRYIMIGGFLGSGKTSALALIAKTLQTRGEVVALITNDQATGLVDTGFLRSRGFSVEEITGGCFCCRFDSLSDAAGKLERRNHPDHIIAEPVGSCTDLVATVSYPLRRFYGSKYTIAPLSVLIDPLRLAKRLGLKSGRSFSERVQYIFDKQIEEADLLVLNKIDLLDRKEQSSLMTALKEFAPGKPVYPVSTLTGEGIEPWLERVLNTDPGTGPTMSVDYQKYAEGEALLGWLDQTFSLEADKKIDGTALLLQLAKLIQQDLKRSGCVIAHLKISLDPSGFLSSLGVVNAVDESSEIRVTQALKGNVTSGEIVVNLRAEGAPSTLRRSVGNSITILEQENLKITSLHLDAFRPKAPVPIHRIVKGPEG